MRNKAFVIENSDWV